MNPRRNKFTENGATVVSGGYLIFLSIFIFAGYRYALYKRKKENKRY